MSRADRVAAVKRRSGYYRLNVEGQEQKFVSVTTVLNTLNKPALVTWAAKTAAELVLDDPHTYSTPDDAARGIYKTRDKAADRGSTIHSIVEAMLLGNEPVLADIPAHLKGHADAAKKFLDTHQPEPLFVEVTVFSTEHRYAGTCDLACKMGGETWLLDWKTSKNGAIYDEVALQLTAYKHADMIQIPARNGEGYQLRPMGKVDRTGAVGLSEKGTFNFKEVEAPLDVFLALKRVYEWQREVA